MNILITGSDGQLGSNLVRELVRRGHFVRALVEPGRKAYSLRDVPVELIIGDILDESDVRYAACGCDAIIHSAAAVEWWPWYSPAVAQVNIEGTRIVINAAHRAGVDRFIYVGSASSFVPGPLSHPATESAPECCDYRSMTYVRSKLIAQQLVLESARDHGLPGIVVNPTFMIGPFGSLNGSSSLLLKLYRRQLRWIPPGGRNFVHVRDVAVGIVNALSLGRIGECYILGHENLPYATAFQRICSALHIPSPQSYISRPVLQTVGMLGSVTALITAQRPRLSFSMASMACHECYYDSWKALNELNLPQHPLEYAVEEAWSWFQKCGAAS